MTDRTSLMLTVVGTGLGMTALLITVMSIQNGGVNSRIDDLDIGLNRRIDDLAMRVTKVEDDIREVRSLLIENIISEDTRER